MRFRLYLRRVTGTLVGVVVAVVLIDMAWRTASAWFPSNISPDVSDADYLAGFVMKMPLGGQAVVALGWLVSGLVGAYVALRIAQWRPAGWVPSVLLVLTGIWNIAQLAQPIGLQAAAVILPLAGAWLAERHFHRARRGDPLIN